MLQQLKGRGSFRFFNELLIYYYQPLVFVWIAMGLLVNNLFAQAPDTLWTRAYGGINCDYGKCVEETSDSGYIVVGYTSSFGAGSDDVYLIKTDANVDTLWTKTYGGTSDDQGVSVQQTSDSGYIITGNTKSFGAGNKDVYLIKTDTNGDTLWTKTYGGIGDDYGLSVQQTSEGGYIITGGTYSFGAGLSDVYLIKTDVNGNILWTRTYGNMFFDHGSEVQEISNGGYIIAGSAISVTGMDFYLIKVDTLGNTIWTRTYDIDTTYDRATSIQETSDSGYIIGGVTDSLGSEEDASLIKTDINGDTLWTKTYGTITGVERCESVRQTSDGGYIIAGGTDLYGGEIYLIKTDANGDTLWTKLCGGTNFEWGYSIRQTSDDGYIVTGYTSSFGAGYYDVYLIKLKPDSGVWIEESSEKIFSVSLVQAPNPFKQKTLIKYRLPKSSNIRIIIYNLVGNEVKTLVNKKENAGIHTIIWDGRDNTGKKVSSGVYFLKFKAEEYTESRKLLVMR